MHRPVTVNGKAEALGLLYVVLAVLRDLTLIAIMTYLITWEVKATKSLNFASTRELGVASRRSCNTPSMAYGCGTQLMNLTSPSDIGVAANVSSLPICYSSTLKTSKSESQEFSLCFDDKNVAYRRGEVKEYENESTMPTGLKCAYNIDNAGSDMYPMESSMLSAEYLEIMFPAHSIVNRNYFPFATLIITVCCLALIMRMTKHLPSRSSRNGSISSSRSSSSSGANHGSFPI